MMAPLFYSLCTLTALLCAILLLRAYLRSRYRLLLWSGLCFAGLTLNNALVVIDKIILGPDTSLFTIRLMVAFFSILLLLYGMIWDSE
jgi:hypothetical protein